MKRFRAPIWLVLALAFAGLVTLTGGVIGGVFYATAYRSTGDLVSEIGRAQLDALKESIRVELEPARAQSDFLSGYILRGDVSIQDDARIADLLLGSLASSPQLFGVVLIRNDLTTVGAARSSKGVPYVTDSGSALNDPLLRLAYRTGATFPAADWGGPVFAKGLNVSGLTHLTPLRRDGQLIGVIATLVSVTEINRQVQARLGMRRGEAFVLLDDGSVLIHPSLGRDDGFKGSTDQPLAKPGDIPDPILQAFNPSLGFVPQIHTGKKLDFSLELADVDDVERAYLYEPMSFGGSRPWTIVLTMTAAELGAQFAALNVALWSSLAVAAVAVLVAIFLGRRITAPINAFANAARHLSALDFARAPLLSRSRLREFDVAAEAYNGMRAGLTWFSTYVPRTLVPALMQPDSAESFTSKEREVTVLFTDIIGFTTIGRRLSAPALARFLNRHFEILGEVIEAEGGTIDKYIGDSVMAFWGAPVAQADHTERAARAALEIGRRLQADNARRKRKGLNPVRVRIGIHCGLALAGNIGAPGRINYTLVGETVNVAQRLEQFGKEIDDDRSDVIIAISGTVADRLPVEIPVRPLGKHAVVERGEPIPVFRLDGTAEEAALQEEAGVTPLQGSAIRP